MWYNGSFYSGTTRNGAASAYYGVQLGGNPTGSTTGGIFMIAHFMDIVGEIGDGMVELICNRLRRKYRAF